MSRPSRVSWCSPLLIAVLLVSGCGHSYDRQVMVGSRPWPTTREVRVFPDAAPGPFEIVALIQSIRHDRESRSSADAVMSALIDQAKRKGCNALSHVRIDIGANKQFAHGYAVCLRRREGGARALPSPGRARAAP